MERIIAAIDGLKYSKSTAYYSTFLAQKACAQLVGVFLDDFTYTGSKISDLSDSKDIPGKKQLESND